MQIVMFDLEQMNSIFRIGNNYTSNCMRDLDHYILYRIEQDTEAYCNLEDKDQVQDRDSFLRVFKQSFQEGIQKAILRETQRRKRDIMERHNSMMEEAKTRKFIWEPN